LGFGVSRYDSLFADVFVPDGGMFSNVVGKGSNALFVMEIDDLGAVFAEPVDAALEIHGLADNDCANPELADKAAAIPAGSERGGHDFVAIAFLTAGFAESIRLAMDGGIVFLDSAIVAAAQELSVLVEQGCTYGNPALGKTGFRLFDRYVQHL
jgi:hypothetical protein